MTTPVRLTRADELAQEGMGQATTASSREAIACLDRLIAQHAATGKAFSANDLRARLPAEGLRPAAVGARFRLAAEQGLIRGVGYEPSSDPRTRGHVIRLWQGAKGDRV